jgi:predicted NAD-dependent protein-ADP-ribosyltransferase YbiA (DUF1768 family)
MKKLLLTIFALAAIGCSSQEDNGYPSHWWEPVPDGDLQWWEISPDAAGENEVVLSKRNELGILSNFADTPFEYRGKRYRTVEGLWQSLLYPESTEDPRFDSAEWPHKREEVEQMLGFPAKEAGEFGDEVMKTMNIDWVTFEGRQMHYWTSEKGPHYELIREVMTAKIDQNPKVREILLSTGDLVLLPDHLTTPEDPPAWRYYQIWTEIRESLK